jgi:type VI secretion system protein ImpB
MATRESTQKKLGRVRPPRVHITYDVHTGGAIEKRELPFVVGVLSDLSGHSHVPLLETDAPLKKLSERRFAEIDRDNFDKIMAQQSPRLGFKVDNKLKDDGTRLGVQLRFKSLADFQPERVVSQVEPLKQLLELREKLSNLRSSLYGNEDLDQALQKALQTTEAIREGSGEGEAGQSGKGKTEKGS